MQKDVKSSNNANENTAHPKWLKALEKESWQPELLISGIAIFAAMQSPALIADFQDYVAFNFEKSVYAYTSVLASYLIIVSYAIAINFTFHFILRVFWIGVLGLMSVYPQGIQFENYPYGGESFVKKLRQKLGTLVGFSLQLDRVCSVIFSLSALIVLSLVSVCILVTSVFVLSLLIQFLLPDYYDEGYNGITITILSAGIVLFSILISILNYTKLKDTSFGEKYHFPIYWSFSTLIFNVLNLPFHYISLTFSTNNAAKKMNFFSVVYFILLFVFIVVNIKIQKREIETRQFYATESNELAMNPVHYDELRTQNRHIVYPSIPSDIIEDKFLKLFIPYPKKLEVKLKKYCKELVLKRDTNTSDFEHNKLQNKVYLQCFGELYSVYLNEKRQENIAWQFYKHSNKGENGIVTYMPTDSMMNGKNVLRIEEWEDEKEEEEKAETKIYEIPFWLAK